MPGKATNRDSTSREPESPALAKVRALLAARKPGEALVACGILIHSPGFAELPLEVRIASWRLAYRSALEKGDYDTAAKAARESWLLDARKTFAALAVEKTKGYQRNRTRLNAIPSKLRKDLLEVVHAAIDKNNPAAAAATGMQFLLLFPDAPDTRTTALEIAEHFLKANPPDPAQAMVCLLRALDTGLDRCFVPEARMAVNQTMLDAVAKAPSSEFIQRAFALLDRAFAMFSGRQTPVPPDQALSRFAKSWIAALSATYNPFDGTGPGLWKAVVDAAPSDVWRGLARIASARDFVRLGRWEQTLNTLRPLEVKGPNGKPRERTIPAKLLRSRAAFIQGLALRCRRQLDAAAAAFQRAAAGPDPITTARARFELARTFELDFKWKHALRLYRRILKDSPVYWDRELARTALDRLNELRRRQRVLSLSDFAVLPEDRTCHGDWFDGYGRNRFVLCAQNYRADRSGGPGPSLDMKFSTTDPKEPGRTWVSKEAGVEDPAAPWDPVRRVHFPANRDDRGEQYPLGAGPDLVLDCTVPAGNFVLSLYFVNDHHFYETNRRYTIEVADAANRVLGLADVRDSGTGVYKRFAVRGPKQLRIRIRRDCSLNVLLSAVFLDPLPALRAPPPRVGTDAPGQPVALRRLAGQYAEMQSRFHRQPVFAYRQSVADLARLSRGLADFATASLPVETPEDSMSPALSRAAAWWMCSECRRLLGLTRPAEDAFDRFLRELRNGLPPADLLDVFENIADRLAQASPNPERIGFAVGRCPTGRHRLDRMWKTAFDGVDAALSGPATFAGDKTFTVRLSKACVHLLTTRKPGLTAYLRERACALLERFPSHTLDKGEALFVVGRAWLEQGNPAQARDFLEKAVACAGAKARPAYFSCLLQARAALRDPPAKLRPLFEKLDKSATATGRQYLLPGAAMQLALAYMRAKRFRAALNLLERHAAGNNAAAPLFEECRTRLASARKDGTAVTGLPGKRTPGAKPGGNRP